ncbi:MAG: flagellar hook-basal body complex protein [Jatrophihabitantaceae bacterium]
MLRSLFTGISGLGAHQQMLDVTANNIANVNTTGYKGSHAVFEDTLSQTLSGSSGATGAAGVTAGTGGTNAEQIGLGVKLAGTELSFTQGASQATGVTSNMLINGDGFFVIDKGGQQLYTRAGNFTLDNGGNLVTPDGSRVVDATTGNPINLSGLISTPATPSPYVSWNIDASGNVNAVDSTGATTVLGQVAVATFANPNGLEKVGDTAFAASANSGAAAIGAANTGARGSISSGYVEMSNVDLSQELTNLIIAERGFQANSKVITTSDEVLQTLVNLKQ